MEPYWKDVAGAIMGVAQETGGQSGNAFCLRFVRSTQLLNGVTVSARHVLVKKWLHNPIAEPCLCHERVPGG